MSKIKEELIGYEQNDWISNDDHVRGRRSNGVPIVRYERSRDAAGR